MSKIDPAPTERNLPAAFGAGAIIGTLGGMIGLGGAEFRLPLLIGIFRFAALEAVILNKAMSLVVVATALPFRAGTVPRRQSGRGVVRGRLGDAPEIGDALQSPGGPAGHDRCHPAVRP